MWTPSKGGWRRGGLFAVATGRAMPAFRKYAAMVPTNAPAVVDNGGAIYDYRTEEYLTTSFLHDDCRKHIAQVMEAFPGLSLEIYHETDLLQVMNPSDWNVQHALLTGMDFQVISDLGEETVPMPVEQGPVRGVAGEAGPGGGPGGGPGLAGGV